MKRKEFICANCKPMYCVCDFLGVSNCDAKEDLFFNFTTQNSIQMPFNFKTDKSANNKSPEDMLAFDHIQHMS